MVTKTDKVILLFAFCFTTLLSYMIDATSNVSLVKAKVEQGYLLIYNNRIINKTHDFSSDDFYYDIDDAGHMIFVNDKD